MKTLMSGPVSHDDLAITNLTQDSDSNHQFNSSTEFMFWSKNFDGLKFLYDHMNVTQDFEKVETIGS